jgi:putative NADPH-quinone reductase
MTRHIVIIQGHPDSSERHFGHALADAYAEGAQQAGHEARSILVAELDFPLVRCREEWESDPPSCIREAQQAIAWADHLVLFYPLWLGDMPAGLKAFLEQVARPGFAFAKTDGGAMGKKLLTGKSARVVVTMGMPAFVYRWFFGAHSLKNLERNVLRFVGIRPVRHSLIGLVEGNPAARERWLAKMRALGGRAE